MNASPNYLRWVGARPPHAAAAAGARRQTRRPDERAHADARVHRTRRVAGRTKHTPEDTALARLPACVCHTCASYRDSAYRDLVDGPCSCVIGSSDAAKTRLFCVPGEIARGTALGDKGFSLDVLLILFVYYLMAGWAMHWHQGALAVCFVCSFDWLRVAVLTNSVVVSEAT